MILALVSLKGALHYNSKRDIPLSECYRFVKKFIQERRLPISFLVEQQPKSNLGRHIVAVPRSHTKLDTHTR